jgi:streptogramin lyase
VFRTDLQPQVLLLDQSGGSLTVSAAQAVSSLPLYAGLAAVLNAPFDAYIAAELAVATQQALVFQGPVLWTANTNQAPAPTSLGAYVPAWFPVLRQAPRGRIGNLWSVTTGGVVVVHNGETWSEAPAIAGATVLSVDVGEDGVPFALATGAGGAALYQFDRAAMAWQPPLGLGSITPQQLAVADAGRVYVLGSDGVVNVLANGSFAPVSALGGGIAHLTANHDGTLWCGSGASTALRFISEQSYGPQELQLPNGAAVQKVASTAYGNALLLVNETNCRRYRQRAPRSWSGSGWKGSPRPSTLRCTALSPLLLVACWQEYASAPDALSLASNVVGALPGIINPIKFAPLTSAAPLVAPVADIACALAAAGLTLGDALKNWDTANNPTGLPEVQEPLPGTANRVFMPAVLQGE